MCIRSSIWQSWEVLARHKLMVFLHLLFNYLRTLKLKSKISVRNFPVSFFILSFAPNMFSHDLLISTLDVQEKLLGLYVAFPLLFSDFSQKMEKLNEYSVNFPVWNFMVIRSPVFELFHMWRQTGVWTQRLW